MIRESLSANLNNEFRLRGKEPGRIETFSDAVFALAITLLLISTTPPTNFTQIKRFLFDLIPFVMCIALIIYIWYEHFTFFVRYGLRNGPVIILNTCFLVIVLFFVYPLKFLTRLFLVVIAIIFDIDWLKAEFTGTIGPGDMGALMIIYGLGAALIYLVLALMYRYALSKQEKLELSPLEVFDTKSSMIVNLLNASVPLVSVFMAIIFYRYKHVGAIAGFTYFLYGPVMSIYGSRASKRRAALKTTVAEEVVAG